MKKFTFYTLTVLLLLSLSMTSMAQQKRTIKPASSKSPAALKAEIIARERAAQFTGYRRCGTMEAYEEFFAQHPDARKKFEDDEKKLAEVINANELRKKQNPSAYRTQVVYTIPVVFHVVLSNQAALTDAQIQQQLDVLNRDFAGLNADSTNIPAQFQAVRGHSNIQFCRAQRTPAGLPTNGIVRVTSSTVSNASTTNDPIKSSAAGGSDQWDPTRYVNIWLGNFSNSSLLGYATFPSGTSEGAGIPANQQGLVILAQSLPGGTAAPYNLGRTLVHEMGHYFWLRHIWGDGAGCADDFPGTPGIDDTPTQNSATSGCPVGAQAAGCGSPNPPGKMYQNFMDYTDDACYSMFTKGQNTRAEQALLTYRLSLTTSDGCTPIVAVNNDASISAIVTPANGSTVACPTVVPVVTITNAGTNNLTSATINIELNSVAIGSIPWSGNLTPGGSTNVTLPAITPVAGSNTLRVYTSFPNGAADPNPANDSKSSTFTKSNGVSLPVTEGFQTTPFPAAGWTLNPASGNTWLRVTNAGAGSTASMKADFWNQGSGVTYSLSTPFINVSGVPQVTISFDVAHRGYPGSNDRLRVDVSSDCGATYTTVYNKTTTTGLATGTTLTSAYTPTTTTAPEWRNESINLTGPILAGGVIIVRFTAVSDFGNNLYVDNINIDQTYSRDLSVTAIPSPGAFQCSNSFVPQVTVKNLGIETVNSYDIVYNVDGSNPQTFNVTTPLAPSASTTITLPAYTYSGTPGAHTFNARTNNPVSISGTGDQKPSNDAFAKPFTTRTIASAPLREGFEGAAFPPAGWSRVVTNLAGANPALPWQKANVGYLSNSSMWMDNYNNDNRTQWSDMITPAVNISGADSVKIEFDLAASYYTDPGFRDTLAVLVSSDCGNTFQATSYKKTGTALATIATPNDNVTFVPSGPADWRHESISLGGATLANGNIIVNFRNSGRYGQSIYVDNINIRIYYKNDIKLVSIDQPEQVVCSASVTPKVTIQNVGYKAITKDSLAYTINGGAPVKFAYNGTINPNGTAQVTLPATTLPSPGVYTIQVYSFKPYTVAPVDSVDQDRSNDTAYRTIYYVNTVSITDQSPLKEGFEIPAGGTSPIFPPAGWGIKNPDLGITWALNTTAGKGSSSSAYMNNYNYNANDKRDELYSPVVTYSAVDSAFLSFDVAAVSYSYPGSTRISLDTLEVLITKDCGATFTSVYKKWGLDLSTYPDPNLISLPQTFEFKPTSDNYWRTEKIDLTAFAGSSPIQVVFRNTENFENNIYIDNINLNLKKVPVRLKTDGYLISPNPFSSTFYVQHYPRAPKDLKGIQVVNSLGQIVWNKQYNGNADAFIPITLSSTMADGIYFVKLIYNNRQVVQRVVKH